MYNPSLGPEGPLKTIGLTGGIGSGKSEAARILRGLGALVIDADEAAHKVYEPGSEGWSEVRAAFGDGVVGADGEIDRDRLGSLVFGDPDKLERLNRIVHPRARAVVAERLDEAHAAGETVAVVEAALLLEAGWDDMFDQIWVVAAPDDEVIERVAVDRGMASDQARSRMRAQMSDEERVARADVTIDNSQSLGDLVARVTHAWNLFRLQRNRQNTLRGPRSI